MPDGRLPAGPWEPLCAWLAVRFPPAAFAVGAPSRARASGAGGRRGDADGAPDGAVSGVVPLRGDCPARRLARWSFAVSADGRTLVRGEPAPPLPGQRFVARCDVAAPAGWRWDPPVDALVLRAAFDVREHDLVLLHADGCWERIGGEQFVQASRAAVRTTEREFRDD